MAGFLAGVKHAVAPEKNNDPHNQASHGMVMPHQMVAPGHQANPEWHSRLGQCCDPPVEGSEIFAATFCLHCVQARAKAEADGTNACYNFLCWHHIGASNWVRRHYGINGACGEDMACGLMCAPCVTRRLMTETRIRGLAPMPYTAGSNKWTTTLFACSGICDLLEAAIFPCCVAHTIRQFLQRPEESDGWFDFLCLIPFSMWGQVRHHYGIQPEYFDGTCDDILVPLFCYPCALNHARREVVVRTVQDIARQLAGGCCKCC